MPEQRGAELLERSRQAYESLPRGAADALQADIDVRWSSYRDSLRASWRRYLAAPNIDEYEAARSKALEDCRRDVGKLVDDALGNGDAHRSGRL